MRLVHPSCRFLLAFFLAGAALSTAQSGAEESLLTEPFAQRDRQLEEIANGETAEGSRTVRRSSSRSQRRVGRPAMGLGAASLEADTSVQSTARGLTPSDTWRQAFPRRK